MTLSLNQKLNRGILFLIPVLFLVITPWQLNETGIWVGYGRHLWAHFGFLYHDNISLLPTDNNITCAWLLSLLYYAFYQLTGVPALLLLHILGLIFSLWILYRESIFKQPWPWTLSERLVIYVLWLGSAGFYSLRPALFAFLPFVLSFLILEKKTLSRRDGWYLIVLEIIWVNLHGSFILLPLMLAWRYARGSWRETTLGLFAVLAASLVNPFGWGVYGYLLRTKEWSDFLRVSDSVSAFSWQYPTQTILFGLLVLFTLGLFFHPKFRNQQLWRSSFVPLLLLSFFSLRSSVFAFFALPVFLKNTKLYSERESLPEPSPWGSAFAFTVLGFLLCLPVAKTSLQDFLPGKIRRLADDASIFGLSQEIVHTGRPDCAILNDFDVGGFLMMTTPNRLLIDGRVTPFTKEGLVTYRNFSRQEQVPASLLGDNICFAVLKTSSTGLIQKLTSQNDFVQTASEGGFTLLMR